MRWKDLLTKFAKRPLFHSSMLKIFPDDPHHIQVQLSRWVDAGKLSQIRKGWYLIEKPYRLKEVPSPVIANTVVHPSYLSFDKKIIAPKNLSLYEILILKSFLLPLNVKNIHRGLTHTVMTRLNRSVYFFLDRY